MVALRRLFARMDWLQPIRSPRTLQAVRLSLSQEKLDPECAQLGRSCAEIVADYLVTLLPEELTPDATRAALVRLGAAIARVSARESQKVDDLAAAVERRVAARLDEAVEARVRTLFADYA